MEVMRRVFTAFESGAARLICCCVYWCPLTPLNGGADARVLLSIVDLYLKMQVSYMLELLSFVFAFSTEQEQIVLERSARLNLVPGRGD